MFSSHDLELVARSFVADVDYHPELGSTNDRALELARCESVPHPLLVLAARQSRGRGRGTNQWWAADGALTFSVLFDCQDFSLPQFLLPQLSLWTGLAVRDALEDVCEAEDASAAFTVKWPNDIYLDGRKVCGVLSESVSTYPGRVVVGIGINVNNRFANSSEPVPEDLQITAASLREVVGRELSVVDVLCTVLDQLQRRWIECASGVTDLQAAWKPHCYLRGRRVTWQTAQAEFIGTCQGLNEDGALVLEENGVCHVCVGGTIVHVQ
ncbi:MAG: biotin--[acetyl-CoA-carboxylase] ligase [Planctomycetales bacterium]|nr:biotin--[acetyl-CoA-carboxylase] ligase [Planctomycetales bacterium]